MVATEVMQKVQLMDCEVTPLEASNVLKNFIDEAINFNKKSRLKLLIGNENADTRQFCGNIENLSYEKQEAKAIIAEARRRGLKVSVKTTLEFTIAE